MTPAWTACLNGWAAAALQMAETLKNGVSVCVLAFRAAAHSRMKCFVADIRQCLWLV